MGRAVVCPDKFRGSLSGADAAAAIAAGLGRAGFDEIVQVPLADGGEGTLDALVAAVGGTYRTARVTGPLGVPVDAQWAVLSNGTAVIEMARASGLALAGGAGHNDPLLANTRGTGELIAIAGRSGVRHVVVAVGGSATTDGGLATVTELGWKLPAGVTVTVACDVTTTFVEAARVYGPQKGATPAQVQLLTRRLERLADEYAQRTGVDVRALAHSGAAGGLAGGLAAIGARLDSGFDVVADAVGLDELLHGAELVVTGEGRVDASSLAGKVVGSVLGLAGDDGVRDRVVVAGAIDADARGALESQGVVALALMDRAWDEAESFDRAAQLLEEAALEAGRAVRDRRRSG